VAVDTEIQTWHSVFGITDEVASDPASLDLICMLVNFLKPKVVVEAGTYRGHMAAAVANILRQQDPDARIYTADPMDTGFRKALEEDLLPIAPWVVFHAGDYLEMLRRVTVPIDLAFIDASSIEDPHLRWTHAMATMVRMRPGGLILVDDTEGDWEDAKAFQGLARTGGIHLPQHRGLTILQRRVA
jgi:predicted O-methyltransferase YrrM